MLLYRSNETELLSAFQATCASFARVACFPFSLQTPRAPLNRIKNAGIDRVFTSHFFFAEPNLSPTSSDPRGSDPQRICAARCSARRRIFGGIPSSRG